MKFFTRILIVASLVLMLNFSAHSQDVFKMANVGIGKANPTQKLDVLGNVQFSGALMPGSAAGAAGNILLSAGAGAAPLWLANGTSGEVLQSNGTSAPTWVAPSSFSVTSIGVTAPIVNTGTTLAPIIGIQGVAANKGGILYSTGLATSATFNTTGTLGNLLLSAGTGAPTWLSNGVTAGMVLTSQGSGAAPTWVTPTVTAWQLTGNSGIIPGTDFVGTTTAEDLVFKTNNTEIMRIANTNDNIGIGTASPNSAARVEIDQDFNGGGIGMVHLKSSGTEAGISLLESGNPNGTQQYSIKDGDNGASQTWFAIHDETNNNQALTITPGQYNGSGEYNEVGINQNSSGNPVFTPNSVFDVSYPGGDGTGNAGITIENNYLSNNQNGGSPSYWRLWVSDNDNYENYGRGGFEIWDEYNQADRFSIDEYSGSIGLGGNWEYSDPINTVDVMGNMALGYYAGNYYAPGDGLILDGQVGIATPYPANNLDVAGNVDIGYDNVNNYDYAPGNGLLVEGNVGLGTSSPVNGLDVASNAAVGTYAGNNTAPTNGLIVSGNVGLGTTSPANALDVAGAQAVGSYAGTSTAPTGGLIVSGQVGLGTSTPSAALDVTSTTQGVLIPRMATAPASPVTSMMYFNTTSGCFMFWNGTTWQSMACGCNNIPAAAGTITGSTTFCTGQTGVTYTVPTINGATNYNWSIPSDATITAGWGTPSITVTFGSASGTISVDGSNSCSTGVASTLSVTNNGASITGQPANASATPTSTATFTVTATGSSLTYQWEYSTNGGGSWSNVTNGAPYSGATTATLTVTDPTLGMSGYEYNCMVTGSCGSPATSNAATLTVCSHVESVPITLTNSQGSTTSANLAVKLTVNFSSFAGDGENSNLNNVEFSTVAGGGTGQLYAWIESGSTPTSGTSTETAPTSSSTAAVVWVNLGSNTIAAHGTLTIYMSFQPSAVMTSTTSYTGMAPQWTSTYGQYDNGASVFPSFYDNFAGTSLASKWTNGGGAILTVNNGLSLGWHNGDNWWAIYTSTFTSALGNIAESYCEASDVNGDGACINANHIDAQLCGPSGSGVAFGTGGSVNGNPNGNGDVSNFTPVASTFYVFSFIMNNPPIVQLSYGLFASQTNLSTNGYNIASGSPVGLGVGGGTGETGTYQWFRIRSYPPSGVLPSASFGTYGCY